MNSPFPGMDPWLELRWADVHTRLTTYASDQMQPQLPAGLHAHIEEYVTVEAPDDPDERRYRFEPDVQVIETDDAPHGGGGTAVAEAIAVAEPLVIPTHSDPGTQRLIKITDSNSGDRVITTIEFLSHANKNSEEARMQFRDKQAKMRDGGVNLVEIDLLRSGGWAMSVYESSVPLSHRVPYRICVTRVKPPQFEVYAAPLQRPLPAIRVPLRAEDKDIVLNLQALVDAAYANGGYGNYFDYRIDPIPHFSDADKAWVDGRLRKQKLR